MSPWPAILIIISFSFGFALHAIKHGQDVDSEYNVFWNAVSIAVKAGILYWGGFFDVLFKR